MVEAILKYLSYKFDVKSDKQLRKIYIQMLISKIAM